MATAPPTIPHEQYLCLTKHFDHGKSKVPEGANRFVLPKFRDEEKHRLVAEFVRKNFRDDLLDGLDKDTWFELYGLVTQTLRSSGYGSAPCRKILLLVPFLLVWGLLVSELYPAVSIPLSVALFIGAPFLMWYQAYLETRTLGRIVQEYWKPAIEAQVPDLAVEFCLANGESYVIFRSTASSSPVGTIMAGSTTPMTDFCPSNHPNFALKIVLGSEEQGTIHIRRLRLGDILQPPGGDLSWTKLTDLLQEATGNRWAAVFYYQDEYGDEITVTTARELHDAIAQCRGRNESILNLRAPVVDESVHDSLASTGQPALHASLGEDCDIEVAPSLLDLPQRCTWQPPAPLEDCDIEVAPIAVDLPQNRCTWQPPAPLDRMPAG